MPCALKATQRPLSGTHKQVFERKRICRSHLNFGHYTRILRKPLFLANIWDVGGARLVESLGAKGHRDDERRCRLVTGR